MSSNRLTFAFMFDSKNNRWYLRRSDGVEIRAGMHFKSVDGFDCEVKEIFQGWSMCSVEHRPSGDYVYLDPIHRPDCVALRIEQCAETLAAARKTLADMGRL